MVSEIKWMWIDVANENERHSMGIHIDRTWTKEWREEGEERPTDYFMLCQKCSLLLHTACVCVCSPLTFYVFVFVGYISFSANDADSDKSNFFFSLCFLLLPLVSCVGLRFDRIQNETTNDNILFVEKYLPLHISVLFVRHFQVIVI